jgi:hypothetical protein
MREVQKVTGMLINFDTCIIKTVITYGASKLDRSFAHDCNLFSNARTLWFFSLPSYVFNDVTMRYLLSLMKYVCQGTARKESMSGDFPHEKDRSIPHDCNLPVNSRAMQSFWMPSYMSDEVT